MKIEKILFKVSGDLVENKDVLNEIKEKAKDRSRLVDILYGFGTRLSAELNRAEIDFEYKNGIRETTEEGLKLALKVSNETREKLKKEFSGFYNISFISPVKQINGKIINTNSDEIVIKEHGHYDDVIVYALQGRNKDKFKDLKNVDVKYID